MTAIQLSPQIVDPAFNLEGLRVLYVDSDLDNRLVTAVSLELFNATVVAVATAEEAIRALMRSPFHVLISELLLPHEDGCSLMQRVRKLPDLETSQIAAIALTACRLEQLYQQAIAVGFDVYHEKPCVPNDLAIVIRALLNHRSQACVPCRDR